MKLDAEILTERDKLLYRLLRRRWAIAVLLIVTISISACVRVQDTKFAVESAIARFETQISQDVAKDNVGSIGSHRGRPRRYME